MTGRRRDGATGRPENEAASREFSSSHAFISPSPRHPVLLRSFLAVLALTRRERPSLVAFAEVARRAAPGERALVRAVAGATVAWQDALDFRVGAGDDVDAYQ